MTEKERQRLEDLWRFDMEKGQGRPVYGMDEVGRGPLAGPVVAACVWMPETWIEGVKDSKKIAEKKRERIAEQIKDKALAYGIGLADVAEIERLNILNATKLAMQRAYEQMPKQDSYVMIDAIDPAFLPAEGEGVVRGDAQSYAIAAASILAKVTRDALMKAYEMDYPGYGWAQNKGYGTRQHIEAMHRQGITPQHRPSFLKGILHDTQ